LGIKGIIELRRGLILRGRLDTLCRGVEERIGLCIHFERMIFSFEFVLLEYLTTLGLEGFR
jgi:hypothetical protein